MTIFASRSSRLLARSCLTTLALTAVSVLPGAAHGDAQAHLGAAHAARQADPRIAAAYGKLPLTFEDVRGRDPAPVDFRARGDGYALWLTPGEAVFALRAPGEATMTTLRMQILGGEHAAAGRGTRPLPGVIHRYAGNDPSTWHTDARFSEVRYAAVYDGIDLVYHGHQGRLEYDFVVAPGADPARIALGFSGAEQVRVTGDGALVVTAGRGELRWAAPVVYQAREGGRRSVRGRYTVSRDAGGRPRVGFAIGAYDRSRPLVIDPTIAYSTFLGGALNDHGSAIAVDSTGQAYVTGYTYSIDFPVAGTPLRSANAGAQDVFVSKFDAAGALVYSTYIGGSAFDEGTGIAVDGATNVYVTGNTSSTNFPVQSSPSPYQSVRSGNEDVFVLKINTTGALQSSTYVGSTLNDHAHGIAVDDLGRPYVVGETEASTFPTTLGAYDRSYNGGPWDAFVLRLANDFTTLSYSTYLGGSSYDYGKGIVLDGYKTYVTGYTSSLSSTSTFPTTAGAYDTSYNGGGDVFVTELAADGGSLLASTFVGGTGADSGEAIARGDLGHIFVTGWTSSTDYPTPAGAYDTTQNGGTDVLVTKLDPGLASLTYSTYIGGSANDYGYAISINSAAGAWVAGLTESTNFPTVSPTQAGFGGGTNDAFVLRVQPTGAALNFSSYLGGLGWESAQGIAVDASNNAYVTGICSDTSFPVVAGYDLSWNGGDDAFVVKYNK